MAERTTGLHRLVTIPAVYETIQVALGGPQARLTVADLLFSGVAGKSVLEIGCGPGTWAPYLTSARSYLGVDWNSAHVQLARQQHGSPTVRFVCGDLNDASIIPNGSLFDVIVGIGILHHLDDDVAETVLKRAAALLDSKGMFIGLEPVYHPRQNPLARILKMCDSGRNIRTEPAYRALMRDAYDRIETEIATSLMRVPYSHCIIRGSNG